MCNLRKSIDTQKVINESVEEIFRYFKEECSYAEFLETMAFAQIEFMQLMEINRSLAEDSSLGLDTVPIHSMTNFIYQVNKACNLLRPFAKLMGQVYGNEQ